MHSNTIYFGDQWHRDQAATRSLNYMLTSSVLHILFFSALWILGSLTSEIVMPPAVEFTVIDAGTFSSGPTAPNKGPVQSKAQAPKAARAQRATHSNVVKVAKTAKVAHPGKITAPRELVAQDLDTEDIEKEISRPVKLAAAQYAANDSEEDFQKVDRENATKLAQLKSQLHQQTEEDSAEQDDRLKALREDTKAENSRLAAEAAKMHAADVSRIQSAQAAEQQREQQAAAAAAAREAANRQAAARDLAARQAAAKAQAEQEARSQRGGNGTGISGVDGPVRDVSELKAMPGNRRPIYESADRLAGRQGEVSFLAYVNSDGTITQFKMLHSSGHRTLDANTFKAIRDWKFFPGQQGWVEIPFRWDLNGEPQEMPATLRRKISQQ